MENIILSKEFVNSYADKKAPWGFNGLGEIVYRRTYSRDIESLGRKEYWHETIERCINGAQAIGANYTKEEAERLLAQLKKEDRERLARLAEEQENADQASSLKAAQSASGVSGRAGTAIKYALAQIGDRYVFGAAGLVTWDCSGLTMRAYQAAGVSLPHSSAAQSRMGKQVSFKSLKPGDLLFYGRPVSHVGIYLGGGKMVHAPRSGSRVKVTESGSLGRKPLVGARRF